MSGSIEDERCPTTRAIPRGPACDLAQGIADSGVHLITGVRYQETAALLEKQRLT